MITGTVHVFKRFQKGVTILEFIAFIGLAAIVVAGALSLYGTATEKTLVADLVKTANGVASDLKRVYANGYGAQFVASNLTGNRVPTPAGWTNWNNAGCSGLCLAHVTKGNRRIQIFNRASTDPTQDGLPQLRIDTKDATLCNRILATSPTVAGVAPLPESCTSTYSLQSSLAFDISIP